MIYTFLKKFEKFYKGVEKFHQKMKNQLKEKSDPKILDLIDNKKEGALRVMQKLNKVFAIILMKKILPKVTKEYIMGSKHRQKLLISHI